MTKERMLNVTEVCLLVGVSQQTIYYWYTFKKQNPKHPLAKLLPKYKQDTERGKRLWRQKDIPYLIQFKAQVPKGRGGIMASITQKYNNKGDKKDAE